MAAICPGLCGELGAMPYRLFLGTLPILAVADRLVRQLQVVFPWYASRKRVKEQANEFLELDLASGDAELILRYAHVSYVRRQIHEELLDKQLTMIETGKATKLADPVLLACLSNCNALVSQRLPFELHRLQQAQKASCLPHRRELNSGAMLEPHDYLCMMRVVEEDVGDVADAEMRARAYLPRDLIDQKLQELSRLLLDGDGGASPTRVALGKKEQKLLQRLIPTDYNKVGCVEKLRPVDVTSYYRFVGERLPELAPTEQYFKRCLYGHVYRKMATHPAYLQSISMYWARHSQLDPHAALTTLPDELSQAVCTQQSLFPALKFRAQYLYTSPDVARQLWRTDSVIPLMRLFPLLGLRAAEDLAAGMVIEAEWARLQVAPQDSPLQKNILCALRGAVKRMSDLYTTNRDAVWKQVEEGVRVTCPPPTLEESQELHGEE